MDDSTRELFYLKTDEKVKQQTHRAAGDYLSSAAGETQNVLELAELLVQALSHYSQAGDSSNAIARNSPQAYDLLSSQGDWERAQSVAAKALEAARTRQDPEGACFWLLQRAKRQIDQEQFVDARKNLEEATSCVAESSDWSPDEAQQWQKHRTHILIQQGRLAYRTQEYDFAYVHLSEALNLAQQVGDALAEADCLIRIGQIERRRGRYETAGIYFSKAQAIADNENRRDIAFECLSYLGTVTRKQGNQYRELVRAYQFYEQANRIAREIGDRLKQEESLSYMGQLAAHPKLGNLSKAEEFLRESLKIAREIHNIRGVRIELTRLINILIAQGKYEEAEQLLSESEQLNRQADDKIGLAWNLKHRGQLERRQGNLESGDRLILQGIFKLVEIGIEEEAWLEEFKALLKIPALCTCCSKDKNDEPGNLPAIQRYKSARINKVHAAARQLGVGFYILSSEFGLIPSEQPIPWYDHLLRVDEVGRLTTLVAEQIQRYDITGLVYFTQPLLEEPNVVPYHSTLVAACEQTGVTLHIVELE